ncbi:ABC transporter ATP-binding protein [soil metagenome]
MPNLTLHNVSKRFGSTVALDDVSLTLPEGKLICFLGPSGCGKTTLLRLIAGLETPSAGRILLGDTDLSAVAAHRRNIGMVFQSFALFPHLNVAENIGYGLKIRGVDKAARAKRAEELLALVQLPGYGQRHVGQLSGGQRQRVAMARALAVEPDLFLLDEPLSALDAKLREAMQVELRLLQQRLGVTTILVTHDQQEAMTVADLIVVMGDNRVQQTGAPLEIYNRPQNRFVADFIGTNNFLTARVEDRESVTSAGKTFKVTVPPDLAPGTEVQLSIRPEKLALHSTEISQVNCLAGRVVFVRDLGSVVETFVDVAGTEIIVQGGQHLPTDAAVWLSFESKDAVVLSA